MTFTFLYSLQSRKIIGHASRVLFQDNYHFHDCCVNLGGSKESKSVVHPEKVTQNCDIYCVLTHRFTSPDPYVKRGSIIYIIYYLKYLPFIQG